MAWVEAIEHLDRTGAAKRSLRVVEKAPDLSRQLFVFPGADYGEYYGDRYCELPLYATSVIDIDRSVGMAFE